MRGLFVTGTDTGAGKTVLSAALLAAMTVAGEDARGFKPVLTGLDEPAPEQWGRDDELLALAGGTPADEITLRRYGPATSPHLAAELAGERIDLGELVAAARKLAASGDRQPILVVEGVGGLLVPIDGDDTVADLAVALGLPLIVAARPGLGTINHTLLTLRAAAAEGLAVRAVVLTPWPAAPGEIERSNRETIARLGGVDVAVLPEVASASREALASAGAALPWRRWLS